MRFTIPLLSDRAFANFTPEEFKFHVISLYHKPVPKPSVKKAPKPYTFRLNRKGTVCIRVNRIPKWLSSDEIDGIAKALKVPSAIVWLKVKAKKSGIEVSAAEEMAEKVAEMPW